MLGEAVRQLVSSGGPLDLELSLVDTIADPPEAHIQSFGTLGFDGIVGDSGSGGIVALDNGGAETSQFL